MLNNCEPYLIHSIRPLHLTTKSQRIEQIKKANYNLFQLPSRYVTFDLLTDSGTGSLSQEQTARMMQGDESYAGSASFERFKEVVSSITGLDYVIPTHQGRAAENVLCAALIKEGDIIPGNAHFDTTKGHIEYRKAIPLDITIDISKDPTVYHPFKGNIDTEKLEAVLRKYPKSQIPFVIVTITCNSGGGQPVSLTNLQEVKKLCRQHGIRLIIDMARFAENAFFIQSRESAYLNHSIEDICKEIFCDVDGAMMSCKKDGISPMGGFLALKDEALYRLCSTYAVLFEGYLTYGGMTGGTMELVAQGLLEAMDPQYLRSRIAQASFLAEALKEYGIPIMEPVGGHAVFIDAKQFLPHIPQSQYPAQVLAIAAYIEGGVRGVEIGTVLADRDPVTRENRYPQLELFRLAIPRRTFTNNHLAHIASLFKEIYHSRDRLVGLKIVSEAPILRHFTCSFEPVEIA